MHPLIAIAVACAVLKAAPMGTLGQDQHASSRALTFSVMTYNIRYDNPDDGVHAWVHRRTQLGAFLRSVTPDVLCVQEALRSQVLALAGELPGYSWRGIGRDDGATKGEHCAIFFNARKFSCTRDSTAWLSPTPDVPSKGWDAALERIVTWVELRDNASGKRVSIFNTHFDHAGTEARAKSAAFVRALVLGRSPESPAVLAGDFNCEETEEPYAILTQPQASAALQDTRALAAVESVGPHGTFSGFALTEEITGPRIDYLFVTHGIAVKRQETLRASRPEGFLSDHLPVIATLTVP